MTPATHEAGALDLARLEELERAASPGPWTADADDEDTFDGVPIYDTRGKGWSPVAHVPVDFDDREQREANAALIAAARNALPGLIDAAQERNALRRRNLEVAMLASKWMEAHDKLKAGEAYSMPRPADLPESVARIRELERENAELRERIYRMTPPRRNADGTCSEHPMDGAVFCASCGGFKEHCRRAARLVSEQHGGEVEHG